MSKKGWAAIDRKLVKSNFWLSETFTKPQAWVDLIVNANHKSGRFWVQGVEIKLKRGQIGWSKRTMASRWGWSRGKVRRFLNWLEKDEKIIQQTVQRKTTIITLVNYNLYQPNSTTDKATDGPPTGHRRYINNNDNNDKNYQNSKNGLFKCTEKELKHIAKIKKLKLSDVKNKHEIIMSKIEDGIFQKKKYGETVYFTLMSWLQKDINEGKLTQQKTMKEKLAELGEYEVGTSEWLKQNKKWKE